MESFVFIIIGAVLFAQGWNLLRVVDLRTVGFLSAAGAIGLLGVATISDIPPASDLSDSLVVTFAILLAVYAAVLAAVGLWDFDTRTLGLYAIFLAVVVLGLAAAYLGVIEDANPSVSDIEGLIGVGALVLAGLFALLFVNLVPPLRRTYQTVTGYCVLIGSAIVAVIGLADFLGLVD
ncbi:MAG: AmiS/UreI family transporter [Dehalococcoidia bacterium]